MATCTPRLSTISFFFQAEDGIRDKLVTGVQTCALPISQAFLEYRLAIQAGDGGALREAVPLARTVAELEQARSEERRVGKECRARWSRSQKEAIVLTLYR